MQTDGLPNIEGLLPNRDLLAGDPVHSSAPADFAPDKLNSIVLHYGLISSFARQMRRIWIGIGT